MITQIPGQLSLFDLLPEESLDDIPEEEMAKRIGDAIGVKFIYDSFFNDYRAKVGHSILMVEYSNYIGCYNDARFIGCGIDDKKNHCGASAPIDSIAEAIQWFERRRNK